MKKLIYIVFMVMLAGTLRSQVTQEWMKTYSNSTNNKSAGIYNLRLSFDKYSSGVYFLKFNFNNNIIVKRILLMK